MKIMIVTTGMEMGGAEMQICLLAKSFVAKGLSVIIVSMIYPKYYVDELLRIGVVVETLKMQKGRPNPLAYKQFKFFVNKYKPNLIHSHMFHANIFCRFYRIFSDLPLISTAHNIDEVEGSIFREVVYRLSRNLSDFSTNVSKEAFEKFCNLGFIDKNKGAYFPNGIDVDGIDKKLRDFCTLDTSVFNWLTVGRLVDAKNHIALIDSAEALKNSGWSNFRINIVGDGPLKNLLCSEISKRGLDNEVVLMGVRDDIYSLMRDCDAFVLPSLWEGQPIVVLEALSLNVPIFVSDIPGVSSLIDSAIGQEYIFSLHGNSMVCKMADFMENKCNYVNHLKGKGFISINHDIGAVSDRWIGLYESKLNK